MATSPHRQLDHVHRGQRSKGIRQLPRPRPPAEPDVTWLLFFDGGSRGNPGAGGAGSVLVHITAAGPRVVWGCATYLPVRTTTNNVAELRGLLEDLRQVWRLDVPRFEVIGDSALILRWMSARRPPKREPLRWAYNRARHFADRLQITGWSHHYCCYGHPGLVYASCVRRPQLPTTPTITRRTHQVPSHGPRFVGDATDGGPISTVTA